MSENPEEIYEYQADSNRKAKVRTLMILSASGVLGAGVLAASALGIGGAVEEISLLDDHESQPHRMQPGGAEGSDVEPEPNQSSEVVTESNTAESRNLEAPGFTPLEHDDEHGEGDGFGSKRENVEHDKDHDEDHDREHEHQERHGFDAEDDEEGEDD